MHQTRNVSTLFAVQPDEERIKRRAPFLVPVWIPARGEALVVSDNTRDQLLVEDVVAAAGTLHWLRCSSDVGGDVRRVGDASNLRVVNGHLETTRTAFPQRHTNNNNNNEITRHAGSMGSSALQNKLSQPPQKPIFLSPTGMAADGSSATSPKPIN